MKHSRIIAVDIGNSQIKFFGSDTFYTIKYDSFDKISENEVHSIIKKHCSGNNKLNLPIFAYSSVNPTAYAKIAEITAKYEIEMFDAAAASKEHNRAVFNDISGMGSDRIMGIIGALAEALPPLITVDCGTATTVNVVDKNSVCSGGFIFPGLYTQALSLAEKTANLMEIPLFYEEFYMAKTTVHAMRQGIIYGMIGSISFFIEKVYEKMKNVNIPIFLTGGGANIIIAELEKKYNIVYRPQLVCQGILYAAENYCKCQ